MHTVGLQGYKHIECQNKHLRQTDNAKKAKVLGIVLYLTISEEEKKDTVNPVSSNPL